MRNSITRLVSVIVVVGAAWAASTLATAQSIDTRFFDAYASEEVTVDNTEGGVALTATKVTSGTMPNTRRAQRVVLRVVCAGSDPCPVNITLDGSAPTTAHGLTLKDTDTFVFTVDGFGNISRLRAIRTGANSGTLHVVYFD